VPAASLSAYGFKYSNGTNYSGNSAAIGVTYLNADGTTNVAPTADGYCLQAGSKSSKTFKYSSPGGLVEGTC
jgi:hypothetical protein